MAGHGICEAGTHLDAGSVGGHGGGCEGCGPGWGLGRPARPGFGLGPGPGVLGLGLGLGRGRGLGLGLGLPSLGLGLHGKVESKAVRWLYARRRPQGTHGWGGSTNLACREATARVCTEGRCRHGGKYSQTYARFSQARRKCSRQVHVAAGMW